MARPFDAARRAELVDRTVEYAARNGIATIALRPLAAALGTTSRMLIHYFGTKEGLIDRVLAAAQPDVPALLSEHAREGHTPEEVATRFWRDLTDGEQAPRLRLLLQVMVLALTDRDQYGRHAQDAVDRWVGPLTERFRGAGLDRQAASARATLLVSGLRGLALDRYVTGDRRRTDDAATLLIAAATAEDPPRSARDDLPSPR